MEQTACADFFLPDPEATADLARRYASIVRPGDTLLLKGPIGAGKTHFARSLIQAWLKGLGLWDDVPSPTFTLVQTYGPDDEVWHTDLYRLTSEDEVLELGLVEAFETNIVLVEWPDRLGDLAPKDAVIISFAAEGDGRRVTLQGPVRLIELVDKMS